jgi:hypothetical protein
MESNDPNTEQKNGSTGSAGTDTAGTNGTKKPRRERQAEQRAQDPLTQAKRDLRKFLEGIETDPEATLQAALENGAFLRSLADIKREDAETWEAAVISLGLQKKLDPEKVKNFIFMVTTIADIPPRKPKPGTDGQPDPALTSRLNQRLKARQAASEGQPRPSPEEESRTARREGLEDLAFLLEEAKTASETFVLTILKQGWFIRSLAVAAREDRPAFGSGLLTLRSLKIKDRDIRELEKAINSTGRRRGRGLRLVEPGDSIMLTPVLECLPDAQADAEAIVPAGYRLSEAGIYREKIVPTAEGDRLTLVEVAKRPLLIAGKLVDMPPGKNHSLRLTWQRGGRWQSTTVERQIAQSANLVADLARYGAPVNTNSAKEIVRWLTEYEDQNDEILPQARIARTLGWQGKKQDAGFLSGYNFLPPDGSEPSLIEIDDLAPSDWKEDWIAYRGPDAGDVQLAQAFNRAGTFEGWLATIIKIEKHPLVAMALYGSFASVLLPILKAPNFCMDWCYRTSRGKTTTLKVAGSVWGQVNDRPSVIATWFDTYTWFERTAGSLQCIPFLLDETKTAKYPELVAQVIYELCGGRGKGRGSVKGTQASSAFLPIVMSTGEQPITSLTAGDGGTYARVLTLWGAPFGEFDPKTGTLVNEINAGLLEHYGWAGPAFVARVQRDRALWPQWQEQYRALRAKYAAKDLSNPIANRIAQYVAALELAASLVHTIFDLPWDYTQLFADAWKDFIRESDQADRAAAALDIVRSWVLMHEEEFIGRRSKGAPEFANQPSVGWAGVWNPDSVAGSARFDVAFFAPKLRKVLEEYKFDYESTMRLWRDNKWLAINKTDGRFTKSVALGGKRPDMVVIKREAFDTGKVTVTSESEGGEEKDNMGDFFNQRDTDDPFTDSYRGDSRD